MIAIMITTLLRILVLLENFKQAGLRACQDVAHTLEDLISNCHFVCIMHQ